LSNTAICASASDDGEDADEVKALAFVCHARRNLNRNRRHGRAPQQASAGEGGRKAGYRGPEPVSGRPITQANATTRSSKSGPKSPSRSPRRCLGYGGRRHDGALSETRSTSWLTRAPADPSSRSGSFRACGPDGQALRVKSSRRPSRQLPRRSQRVAVLHLHPRRRKGLADTALKTADSGYLTAAWWMCQDVIVTELDCGTAQASTSWRSPRPARHRAAAGPHRGRVALEDVLDYEGKSLVAINQEITEELASAIQSAGIER